MRVLILGATGLLGSSLSPILLARGHEVYGHGCNRGQHKADLRDRVACNELLERVQPQTIINLVALTDVERCERYPNEAYEVNVRTVENVCDWISERSEQCYLIQFSTDQVYDGPGPHSEAAVTLRNYYAFSKYAAELVAARVDGCVLRTNFVGHGSCSRRRSLTDWLFKSLVEGSSIQVFEDIYFNPLSIDTLCDVTDLAISKRPSGIFNVGSRGGMSKSEFAFNFGEKVGLVTACMTRTSSSQAAFLKAYRPKDMRMNVGRIEVALDIVLPELVDEIGRVAAQYRRGHRAELMSDPC